MNYGLYIAAGGALNSMHRLDVASNNLANVNTTGFKRDFAVAMQRDAARIEDNLFNMPSSDLLERLGGGVLAAPIRTAFNPAAPEVTHNPLDVAIRSAEGFFVVRDGAPGESDALRLTRDGRFLIGPQGTLVTAADGLPVLDERDQPIRLDPALPAHITPTGEVVQDGQTVARLQVAGVSDPAALEKLGAGLYRSRSGEDLRTPVRADLLPGAVETSGVNPVMEMMAVSDASRGAQANLGMVNAFDELMDRAINVFGRVG